MVLLISLLIPDALDFRFSHWIKFLYSRFAYQKIFSRHVNLLLHILTDPLSSAGFWCSVSLIVCFVLWHMMSFPAIDERAWWNGKDQCKTLCCSWRGDTWALQEKWGKPIDEFLFRFWIL